MNTMLSDRTSEQVGASPRHQFGSQPCWGSCNQHSHSSQNPQQQQHWGVGARVVAGNATTSAFWSALYSLPHPPCFAQGTPCLCPDPTTTTLQTGTKLERTQESRARSLTAAFPPTCCPSEEPDPSSLCLQQKLKGDITIPAPRPKSTPAFITLCD